MNKYILDILKKMAKRSDIRQTEAWTESKKEMISILTKKIQKIKVDQRFKDVNVNDFHMGTHSLVSRFTTSLNFKKRSFQTNLMVILSITRMVETKCAIRFQSTCAAYSFCLSSQWAWFYPFYLHQKLAMKK